MAARTTVCYTRKSPKKLAAANAKRQASKKRAVKRKAAKARASKK